MIAEKEGSVLADLSVADEFVLPQKSVEIYEQGSDARLLPKTGQAKLSWLQGDPTMVPTGYYREKPNGIVNKPKVLYVSGAFIGFRQRIPPRIPDIVKLDCKLSC